MFEFLSPVAPSHNLRKKEKEITVIFYTEWAAYVNRCISSIVRSIVIYTNPGNTISALREVRFCLVL